MQTPAAGIILLAMVEPGLTIAAFGAILLATVVLVIYPVCRILFAFVRYEWKERHRGADPEFMHPQLGLLTGRDGLWSGEVNAGRQRITVYLSGSNVRPDDTEAAALLSRLAVIERLEEAALDLLVRETDAARDTFSLICLEAPSGEAPKNCAMEFAMRGNDFCVYRVEMEGERAVFMGEED